MVMSSSTPPEDEGIGLFSNEPGEAQQPARRAKPKKKRGPKIVMGSILGILALVLIAGFVYAFSIDRTVSQNLNRADNLPPETPTGEGQSPRPKKEVDDKSINFVLMGSDARKPDSENGRSDTLMILHVDGDRKGASIISFPRDMYVEIPGHGKNKINAAYSFGGPQLSVQTLESLTGARMDHVAQVNFEGFINLTETLGGVTVKNKHEFSSHGYDYPKGEITIEGEEALWYVRERKSLPNGDLDRSANQRKVMQAILAKGLSADTISNPLKFNAFVGGIAKDITVDSSLTDSDIRKMALSLRLTPGDIDQIQAPISGFDTVSGAGSIDVVDEAKMKELSKALKKDKLASYVKKYPEDTE
jgi:LCP family protein required for cell wall assembly